MSKPNNENALASEAGGGARAAEGSSAAPTTQVNGGAANDKPVVRIEGLRKSFGDNVVLRGIDLDIRRGEVVVILGPSGSGKSTLLRCVNLLETPTDGKIFFEDTEITAKKTDINNVRAKVGMVFQSFNLFPHLTAKANVMLAQQKVLKRSKAEAERVAIEHRLQACRTVRRPAAARRHRPCACHGPARYAVR